MSGMLGQGGVRQSVPGPPGQLGLSGERVCPPHAHYQGSAETVQSLPLLGGVQMPWCCEMRAAKIACLKRVLQKSPKTWLVQHPPHRQNLFTV